MLNSVHIRLWTSTRCNGNTIEAASDSAWGFCGAFPQEVKLEVRSAERVVRGRRRWVGKERVGIPGQEFFQPTSFRKISVTALALTDQLLVTTTRHPNESTSVRDWRLLAYSISQAHFSPCLSYSTTHVVRDTEWVRGILTCVTLGKGFYLVYIQFLHCEGLLGKDGPQSGLANNACGGKSGLQISFHE